MMAGNVRRAQFGSLSLFHSGLLLPDVPDVPDSCSRKRDSSSLSQSSLHPRFQQSVTLVVPPLDLVPDCEALDSAEFLQDPLLHQRTEGSVETDGEKGEKSAGKIV